MTTDSAIDLMFGGMEKLGPGSDADTLHVLRLLPHAPRQIIVDAGCGTGRQTLVLAQELGTLVHAVDSHEPFLTALNQRAASRGIGHLVQAHVMDMKDIPRVFPAIDLLWSEGSAYSIGFANALAAWAPALRPGGFCIVSELAWLRDDPVPALAQEFFSSAYPEMQHTSRNVAAAQAAGYAVIHTHTLPQDAWVEGYYDVLEARANALVRHPENAVRDFARETMKEIEVFRASEGSYGYVFYVLQRG